MDFTDEDLEENVTEFDENDREMPPVFFYRLYNIRIGQHMTEALFEQMKANGWVALQNLKDKNHLQQTNRDMRRRDQKIRRNLQNQLNQARVEPGNDEEETKGETAEVELDLKIEFDDVHQ